MPLIIDMTNSGMNLEYIYLYTCGAMIVPNLFKPVFGYIGDNFFPFGYRIKGYVIIIATINIIAMFFMISFGLYGRVIYIEVPLIAMTTFLDSIAQGMTTLTI